MCASALCMYACSNASCYSLSLYYCKLYIALLCSNKYSAYIILVSSKGFISIGTPHQNSLHWIISKGHKWTQIPRNWEIQNQGASKFSMGEGVASIVVYFVVPEIRSRAWHIGKCCSYLNEIHSFFGLLRQLLTRELWLAFNLRFSFLCLSSQK